MRGSTVYFSFLFIKSYGYKFIIFVSPKVISLFGRKTLTLQLRYRNIPIIPPPPPNKISPPENKHPPPKKKKKKRKITDANILRLISPPT